MKRAALLAFALAAAAPARAAFRASDQLVVVGVARTAGAAGSFWVTDLTIYNPGNSPATADLAFLPTGGGDNTAALSALVGVGPLDPGQSIVLPDVLQANFGIDAGSGALLIFGSDAQTPALIAPLIASARVYDAAPAGTFGLSEYGLPYYDQANPAAGSLGADTHVLIGLEQDAGFRANVGVWNGSDPSTSIVVRIDFFDSRGLAVGSRSVSLAPLGHLQLNAVLADLGVEGSGFSARATLASFTSTEANARPYFFAYGAVIDNRTNDPIFVEPAYAGVEPVDCIFH